MRNNSQIDSNYPNNAISLYDSGNGMDDFPVLKAFQQYIDAEQAKARKRMLTMGIFFGVSMFIVVAIFVALLVSASNRNQNLNDRLLEFAMREHPRQTPATKAQADDATVLSVASKLEEMQKKVLEAEAKARQAIADAEEKSRIAAQKPPEAKSAPTPPSETVLEIQRLKLQIEADKQKAALEKERQHQEELELYRRKHYPELYQKTAPRRRQAVDEILADLDALAEDETKPTTADLKPVRYFDDEEESSPKAAKQPAVKNSPKSDGQPEKTEAPKESRSITIKNGESSVSWGIPD